MLMISVCAAVDTAPGATIVARNHSGSPRALYDEDDEDNEEEDEDEELEDNEDNPEARCSMAANPGPKTPLQDVKGKLEKFLASLGDEVPLVGDKLENISTAIAAQEKVFKSVNEEI
jgi:hypothetical protein